MRVAIDVTSAVTQRAGVGRYTRELVGALLDLPDAPELLSFYVATQADELGSLDARTSPRAVSKAIRNWRFEVLLRHLLRRPAHGPWDGASLYHAPDVVYPPIAHMPVVMTVHDLSYIVYPHFHTRLNGSYLRAITPLMARRAHSIIAVSQSTKRDLVERIGVPENKVQVIHPGVPRAFMGAPSDERLRSVRETYGLGDRFILSVGTLEPRKNLAGILQSYRLLRRSLPDAPPLLLVGGSGWKLDERGLIQPEDADHVRLLGFVPDADLAALYASCTAFVYPSLHEGWGFPVAEALSQGAPTVTSAASSLPEVAGDAALLVDPRQPQAIAEALHHLLTDGDLAARLRRAGPQRAAQITLRDAATATLQVYRDALAPGQ